MPSPGIVYKVSNEEQARDIPSDQEAQEVACNSIWILEILLALERSKVNRPLRTDEGENSPRGGCDRAESTVRRITKGSVRVIERGSC